MTRWTLALLLALGVSGATAQDVKPIPRDSTRLVVTGCLKGRMLTAIESREPEVSGPDVTGRSFRLSGPKALMADIKRFDRQVVEVIGLVKTSALVNQRTGAMFGRTRVVVGPPMSTDPTKNPARNPDASYVVMDASSVRFLSETCPLFR
jgi:hypothetical protein